MHNEYKCAEIRYSMASEKNILLSEEQLKFVKKALGGKNVLLDASEGCGKTTALIEFCDRLPGKKKVIYFTIDRNARNDVESAIKKSNVFVTYYQGFAFKELRRIGVYGDPEELLPMFAKVKPDVSGYNILIVDGFQFLDEDMSKMIEVVKSKNENMQIIAAGNTEQRFYDKNVFDAKNFADGLLGSHDEVKFENCYTPSLYSGSDKGKGKESREPVPDDDMDFENEPEETMAPMLSGSAKIAVLDAEVNQKEEVMSIGVVVADSKTFKIVDERYYILTPESNVGGKYLKALRVGDCINAPFVSRNEAVLKIGSWLQDCGVSAIFAYNAESDMKKLPEFDDFYWYDIMKIAAYKQYNSAITGMDPVTKDGRLKKDFGLSGMIRRLSGSLSYSETHNALYDARDELRVMELLGLPIDNYEPARVDTSVTFIDDDSLDISDTNVFVFEDDAITAAVAEQILGVEKSTIYKLVKRGEIVGYKRDNHYVISKKSVLDYREKLDALEAKRYKKTLSGILIVIFASLVYLWHLAAQFF